MRILLGFPQVDEQTGVWIKQAFIEAGHEVVGVHDAKLYEPTMLLTMARQTKPDLIFMSRTGAYVAVIQELRKIALTAFWNVDVRNSIGAWKHLYPLMTGCHFWFTIAKGNIPAYKKAGLGNPYWLSEGCAALHTLRPEGRTEEFDAFFAGALDTIHETYAQRRATLEAISGTGSKTWYHKGGGLINEAHNDAIGRSKVCIGTSGWPQVELSMSARDYRIMGAGGFLLTNHVEGIEDWFKIGVECDTYRTPEEAKEKFLYYCDHPEERIKIADAGYKVAHEKHRFKHRMEKVIEVANNYR